MAVIILIENDRSLLMDLLEKEIKRIRRKYKKRIQEDWYDMSEEQAFNQIRNIDRYYDRLCIIRQAI